MHRDTIESPDPAPPRPAPAPVRRDGLRRVGEAHRVPWVGGCAIGIGAFAGIVAGGVDGSPGWALAVFSAALTGGSTYLGLRLRGLRRTQQEPAVPVRSLAVFFHPADATYGEWIAACLGTAARTRVEPYRALDPPAATPDGLPTWSVCVLSATWDALGSPMLDHYGPDAERLVVVRIEDCATPAELDGVPVVDIGGLDEAGARTLLFHELAARGILAEADVPDTSVLPSAGGTPFPHGGPAITNLRPPDPTFVGRDALVRDLRAQFLHPGDQDDDVSAVAAVGMGGVGKSSLAANYAHRYRRHYDIIWWITADRPTSLSAGLVRLALRLGVPELADADLLIAELRRALRERGQWLLIFDNADSVEDLRRHWPSGDGGHVLITSRLADWSGLVPGRALLQVPPLPGDHAVRLLCEGTGDDDPDAARTVARLLGQLPLALTHAVAYVRQAAISLAVYGRLLEDSLEDVLTRFQPADDVQPVAMTWNLTLRRAAERRPLTLDLMRLWAMLAPEGLTRDLAGEGVADLPGHLTPVAPDSLAYDLAVQQLHRYSLIRIEAGTAGVHRLVQSVVRKDMDPATAVRWLATAAGILDHLFPADVDDRTRWPVCSRLLPHVLALHGNHRRLSRAERRPPGWADTEVVLGRLLYCAGRYLIERSSYDEAAGPLTAALTLRENAHGARSREVAETQLCLAIDLYRRADIVGALQAVTTALEIQEHLDGRDSPSLYRFLLWKSRILVEFSELGEASTAAEHGRRVLAAAGDADDPRLIEIDTVRGTVMWRRGRFREAVETLEGTVEGCVRLYGAQDDRTLAAEGSAAFVQAELGRVLDDGRRLRDTAERLTRISGVLADRLGDTHFEVVEHHKTLAATLTWLGDVDGARRVIEPVVGIYREILGRHPSTVAAEKVYAVVLAAQGETERARRLLEDGERLYEGLYGSEHPYVAEVLVEYGPVLAAAGRTRQARDVLERARRIVEETYGPGHPKLVQILTALARLPGVGDEEAGRLRRRASSIKAQM
ncbi:tetratricopeptide repeat protein [Spirillospora sp. NPDC049652]